MIALLLVGAVASAALARNDIVVVDVAGDVQIVDGPEPAPAIEPGYKLRPRSRIKVPADGRLVMALSNGARVLVEGASSFEFTSFLDGRSRGSVVEMHPEYGQFTVALPRQGPADTFALRTSQGLDYLRTRGLYQLTAASPGGRQQLVCLAGEVLFVPVGSERSPCRLTTGQQLSVGSTGPVLSTSIQPMDAQDRRAIVERLAYEREFKVYPLDSPLVAPSTASVGGSSSLDAVIASIEEVVERQAQLNPSPTGG